MYKVDYDRIARSYDERYAAHDHSGIETTLSGAMPLSRPRAEGRNCPRINEVGEVTVASAADEVRDFRPENCRYPAGIPPGSRGSARNLPLARAECVPHVVHDY